MPRAHAVTGNFLSLRAELAPEITRHPLSEALNTFLEIPELCAGTLRDLEAPFRSELANSECLRFDDNPL